MDDESCVMRYIEIVPHDDFANYEDSMNIKQEPEDSINNVHIKVCM